MSIPLQQQQRLLLGTLLAAIVLMLTLITHGYFKPADSWSWLDIVGEGGMVIMAVCWLLWLARSRPAGRVTLLLLSGVAGVLLSLWADWLDEFIKLSDIDLLDKWLENAPMLIGLVLLTVGIYQLQQEQLALNQHMRKRERLFREHRDFDALTPLNGAAYLRRQLRHELQSAQPFALIRLELKRFEQINREHGHAEGDRVLQSISQLLVLNLREQDLLCRLAGDRFVALLPQTSELEAEQVAADLELAVLHYPHKTRHQQRVLLQARTRLLVADEHDSVDSLMTRLSEKPALDLWYPAAI